MAGFFAPATLQSLAPPVTSACLPRCGMCGLYKTCADPKVPPQVGQQAAGLLVVIGTPSPAAAAQGDHLTVDEFILIRHYLRRHGYDQENCVITSAAICPADEVTDEQLSACLPNLLKVIDEHQPSHIVLFGESAARALLPHLWGDNVGEFARWVGWVIPCRSVNAWLLVLPDTTVLAEKDDPGLAHVASRSFSRFFASSDPPYRSRATDDGDVKLFLDTDEAARWIDQVRERGGEIAFDYETNMLKPDSDTDAEIFCAGISWQGRKTFAYPWHGAAIAATSRLLQSDVPKIGANIKFEDRWTRAKLGHGVRNWVWDTMQAAHVLDNRPGITGVKFQAFVRLGRSRYDGSIHSFLEARHAREKNQVSDIPLDKLLRYCALDALYEYELAQVQRAEMGITE